MSNPIPQQRNTDELSTLLHRYAVRGPRYTSYPTALNFSDSFSDEDYKRQLLDARASTSPLSLYVHIPFCRSLCYYCACNKVVTKSRSAARRYLDHLHIEIELLAKEIGRGRKVAQLHLGGGTPNFLDDAEMTELIHMLASHFTFDDSKRREYSIEIDPRTVTPESLALLRGLGFNRLSFGIQDTDPKVQQAINRLQPFDDVKALVETARVYRFRSISTDLIYGLPRQSAASFDNTLTATIDLAPDRIALYHYAHLPQQFKWQRALEKYPMPDAGEKLAILQLAIDRLTRAGYLHIGMDHFVKPEDELAVYQREGRLQRNFQGYSTCMSPDVLAIGVSAITSLRGSYAQNHKNLDDYYAALEAGRLPTARGVLLTAEDQLRRFIIMQLACNLKLDCKLLQERFHVIFAQKFADLLPALKQFQEEGILEINHEDISVTERGRLFLRNICMLFDTSLETSQAHYSKVL